MFEHFLCFESSRVNRGITHEVHNSGYYVDTDMSAVAYDEQLLACEGGFPIGKSKERFIIQDTDKLFVDYHDAFLDYYNKEHEPSTINCKTFTSPPKPSSTLKNLTTHTLPEDVTGLIGSFNYGVHCNSCQLSNFNMTFLARCRVALASNRKEWRRVAREVLQEGGSCGPTTISSKEQTLQTCMTSPKANQVAVCRMGSDRRNLRFIEQKENEIKENEDIVQASKRKMQERQEFLKETQDIIKKKQENIADLQDVLDMRKQNIVYIKQIFEGL